MNARKMNKDMSPTPYTPFHAAIRIFSAKMGFTVVFHGFDLAASQAFVVSKPFIRSSVVVEVK